MGTSFVIYLKEFFSVNDRTKYYFSANDRWIISRSITRVMTKLLLDFVPPSLAPNQTIGDFSNLSPQCLLYIQTNPFHSILSLLW